MEGTVSWFNAQKGYGFIESKGKQYFVHFSSIKGRGYKSLQEGQKVYFRVQETPKGYAAIDVSTQLPTDFGDNF